MALPNPVKAVKRVTPTRKAIHQTIQYGALVPAAVAIVTALCASFHWHLNLEQQASIAGLLAMVVAAILNATDAPAVMTPAELSAAAADVQQAATIITPDGA